ncbi:protein of unknown function [Xenorhabdus poinarii G6]|uniref:Uncharacterized protein n=1 Tax=Xenorhabdus poinarii G6 TaxID=1354304 RepID=A0A068QYB9_9GAMM|nr:hypothetical protein [Xenorhabdus poinarii]CDG19958.1 protein of unknown function [Xenorhabdus poinarii G6]
MHPTTISHTYVEIKKFIRHGREYTEYTYLGDLQIDMSFSEFVKRSKSGPEPSEVLKYIMAHYDEERLTEEFQKMPGGNRYLAALTRQVHKEVA